MQRASSRNVAPRLCKLAVMSMAAVAPASLAFAGPQVEFDFVRVVECPDVTPLERAAQYPTQRLVQFTLPVSVRFLDVSPKDVDELTIEINGAAAGLRVHDFAPPTTLASDFAREIETTTTTKSGRSIDATLGGQLPVPYAEVAAHVAPSISAGSSSGETVTEKLNRLPPKHAVVVSGTSFEGRGVFFKLKPSSQTSLEGAHELSVTFIVPVGWRGAHVQVGCSARGQRKLLWVIKQDATLGSEGDRVRLYLAGPAHVRRVAKPVVAEAPRWIAPRPSAGDVVVEMVTSATPATVDHKDENQDEEKEKDESTD